MQTKLHWVVQQPGVNWRNSSALRNQQAISKVNTVISHSLEMCGQVRLRLDFWNTKTKCQHSHKQRRERKQKRKEKIEEQVEPVGPRRGSPRNIKIVLLSRFLGFYFPLSMAWIPCWVRGSMFDESDSYKRATLTKNQSPVRKFVKCFPGNVSVTKCLQTFVIQQN